MPESRGDRNVIKGEIILLNSALPPPVDPYVFILGKLFCTRERATSLSYKTRLLDYYRLAFYVAARAHLVRVAGGSRPMTLGGSLIESSVAYARRIYFHLREDCRLLQIARRRRDATRRAGTGRDASARMKNDDGHYSRIGETVWRLPERRGGH